MEVQQIITLSVFAATLILSATRLAHPAAVALAAALALAVWLGPSILTGVRADILLTSAGVMVLAGFLKRSGLVSWLTLNAAKSARGRPRGILIRAGLLAFVAGAFFGPAAAALIIPVALLLAVELDVASLPFLVTLPWCAVLGSTAILTSQPGNLWVGTALGLDGGHWLTAMLPFSAAALLATLVLAAIVFRRSLRVTNERRARVLEYDTSKAIENGPLAAKTVAVVLLVVLGLALQPVLHVEPVVIVLIGALLLSLIAGRSSVSSALAEIDGAGLLWYGALLTIVGVVSASGAWALASWHPGPLAVLWLSAAAGTFIDPGTVAGSLASAHESVSGWPLVVLGSALGGAATLWTSRSMATNAPRGKGPAWTKVAGWGILFAVVNLLVVSGLWVLLR